MSGRGVSKLRTPPNGYWPGHYTERDDGKIRFETYSKSEGEDSLRSRLLRSTTSKWPAVVDRKRALDLAERLENAVLQEEVLESAASSLYWREHRGNLAGWLWWLRDRYPHLLQALCTVICQYWEIPAADLERFAPSLFLNRVRSLANYYGAGQAEGYLAAGLHSEFVPETEVFRMHIHAIAAGGMIDVVDTMRQSPMLRGFTDILGEESVERRAVKIQRDLKNLPDPLTYAVQSFAPVRLWGSPGTGEMRGKRRRIPEPYHSQYLLWLDRWRLEDLTLLIGLRVTASGLKLT